MNWLLELNIRGGHRYFRCQDPRYQGRIALADASGSTPENTEDGILWLDTNALIVLNEREDGSLGASIPLFDLAGHRCYTGEYAGDALEVAAHFRMSVEVNGTRLVKMFSALKLFEPFVRGKHNFGIFSPKSVEDSPKD